jgi:predicted lipid-binding transport protein (Tim44 family)
MGGLLMMLLLAGGAFFLFSSFRKRSAGPQAMQYAGAEPQASQPGWRDGPQAAGAGSMPMPFGGASSESAAPVAGAGLNGNGMIVPEGFDKDAFLRQAKVNFMRLQAANDRKDLHDIRNFTTPEMYAEISLEAQERGTAPQETDVTDLSAELLDVTEGSEEHLASVRFFGKLREAANSESEAFNEVWHLAKPVNGQTGWLLAGIQQYT